jgi:hypothetical protein
MYFESHNTHKYQGNADGVYDGVVADTFGPDMHAVSTLNVLPNCTQIEHDGVYDLSGPAINVGFVQRGGYGAALGRSWQYSLAPDPVDVYATAVLRHTAGPNSSFPIDPGTQLKDSVHDALSLHLDSVTKP